MTNAMQTIEELKDKEVSFALEKAASKMSSKGTFVTFCKFMIICYVILQLYSELQRVKMYTELKK